MTTISNLILNCDPIVLLKSIDTLSILFFPQPSIFLGQFLLPQHFFKSPYVDGITVAIAIKPGEASRVKVVYNCLSQI